MTTMQCPDIKALLSGLVDDEIDGETRHLAERHIATCRPCRALLDEAEALDQLIVADGASFDGTLPGGFEDDVFDRISAPFPLVTGRRRLTTWMGWMAAAAALALAISIWIVDRRTFLSPPAPEQVVNNNPVETDPSVVPPAPGPAAIGATLASRKYVFGNHGNEAYDSLLSRHGSNGPFDDSYDDHQGDGGSNQSLSDLSDRPQISIDDAQTLYSVSILLDLIAQADKTSFKDVEMVREIAAYDDLLVRLAEARRSLPAEDRPLVFAAEAILTRVVKGTLELQDLQDLRDTIERLNLTGRVETLSDRGEPA